MKALLALAALVAATPATGPGTPYYSGMPPVRYQGEGIAIVAFVDDVSPYCGTAPAGLVVLACTQSMKDGTPVIIMPNACLFGDVDAYARILCHERGHAAGWPSNHPL